mmetsp:Transcript_45598/g.97431  ORF Transcript_45598/g.97431 Transcript_45598/m.97431 type:complete len:200 (-) Transcript_45598:1865-2464(-)
MAGSGCPTGHFSAPPWPVEMRSSLAAADSEKFGTLFEGRGICTSPAGSQAPSSSSKSTMLESPLKATAARSRPESGTRAAAAASREEPPRGNGMATCWQAQKPSEPGRPPHSASAPLAVATRRPEPPQEAPSSSPRPSVPRKAKEEGSACTSQNAGSRGTRTMAPRWSRARAARSEGLSPEAAARKAGRSVDGQLTLAR